MDKFFDILKKSLILTLFVIFGFTYTYVPHTFNQVEPVAADFDPWNFIQNSKTAIASAGTLIKTTASAAFDKITSFTNQSLFTKEFTLDGIAWALAKGIVSSMVNSLIVWINSGFEGSPAFIQDLEGFLRNSADEVVGEYIESLGGAGSFVCSPFRLDVKIALALQYQRAREDKPPTCTLTGIIDNIEGFISGTQGSFSENGGWNDWIDITSQPEVYTPYGTILAAQQGLEVRVLNAKNIEYTKSIWGNGFLSGEACETAVGSGGTTEKICNIIKPGKVTIESLNKHLYSGIESLITADEIDEVMSALMGQLANTAITGVAGLLGLSSGNPRSYSGFSAGDYISELGNTDVTNTAKAQELMNEGLKTQKDYRSEASRFKSILEDFAESEESTPSGKKAAEDALDDIDEIISKSNANIITINAMITEYGNPNTTTDRRTEILDAYTSLDLYSKTDIFSSAQSWQIILNDIETLDFSDIEIPEAPSN